MPRQRVEGRLMKAEMDAFHEHLDSCAQCFTQAFNLCPVGDLLLQCAVKTVSLPDWAHYADPDCVHYADIV